MTRGEGVQICRWAEVGREVGKDTDKMRAYVLDPIVRR